ETANRSKLLLHAAHLSAAGNRIAAAKKLFREAIVSARSRLDAPVEPQALTGRGKALLAEGRAAESMEYLQMAVNLRQQINDNKAFYSYSMLADAHAQLGNHSSALELFD